MRWLPIFLQWTILLTYALRRIISRVTYTSDWLAPLLRRGSIEFLPSHIEESMVTPPVYIEISFKLWKLQRGTASTTMQIISMRMLNSTVIFIRGFMSYMSKTYTTLNQAFSYTTESWYLVWFLVEEMFTSDFFPVKADMVSADVVKDPRACAGLVFWY